MRAVRTLVIVAMAVGWTPTVQRAIAQPVASVGVSDSAALPGGDHVGCYADAGRGVFVERGPLLVVPVAGVAAAPWLGRWGAFANVTGSGVVNDHLTIDVFVLVSHDQAGLDLDG